MQQAVVWSPHREENQKKRKKILLLTFLEIIFITALVVILFFILNHFHLISFEKLPIINTILMKDTKTTSNLNSPYNKIPGGIEDMLKNYLMNNFQPSKLPETITFHYGENIVMKDTIYYYTWRNKNAVSGVTKLVANPTQTAYESIITTFQFPPPSSLDTLNIDNISHNYITIPAALAGSWSCKQSINIICEKTKKTADTFTGYGVFSNKNLTFFFYCTVTKINPQFRSLYSCLSLK